MSRMRLCSEELTFEVSRRGERADACSTVRHGGELLAERTVRLGPTDTVALLSEELRLLGRDETYEAALRMAVGMLDV